MSATGRGSARAVLDQYQTPAWCVERLLEALPLETDGKKWLEPCANKGAIIQAVNNLLLDNDIGKPDWSAFEIDDRCLGALTEVVACEDIQIGDFFSLTNNTYVGRPWDVVLTNPPFLLAQEFIERSLCLADTVVMLLRLNFLGSEKRADWLRANTPAVYVLPNRPSFTTDGGTDATEYCWAVWGAGSDGRVHILDTTPKEIRRRRG